MKNTLARLRRERGLTQEELARRLYITRQAVSRWETGATEPGIDMIKLIARARCPHHRAAGYARALLPELRHDVHRARPARAQRGWLRGGGFLPLVL
ncbi:helix-turn-helix transcriptional regulator [Collinsella ihumii]|uniref:helix-turn-helix transcriptional regulator n=1 Tax=Collinsella ihumii TaxID=1720204 RepID=UPI0025AAC9E5|nr:helix-turn-helix transcriptional regulator [Collinsella ihumii]MDN0055512.1 helix-turn-helix transcriptional regulator [Collinsella ihumii]